MKEQEYTLFPFLKILMINILFVIDESLSFYLCS